MSASLDQFNMTRSAALDMARDGDGFSYDDDMSAEDMDDMIDSLPRYEHMTPESIRIAHVDHMPRNAWLDPNGTLYNVDDYDHANVAYNVFGDDRWGDGLEERGWLHISVGLALYVTCSHPRFTQAQMDTLWDIYMARPDHMVGWQRDAVDQLRRLLNITVQ